MVGGSRGLGEVTAKLVAAGGGRVTLTYKAGRGEAERVVEEMKACGSEGQAIYFDSLGDPPTPDPPSEPFMHLYYFASPRIRPGRPPAFDNVLFQEYVDYYVQGLSRTLNWLWGGASSKLCLFYPSSVFVDQKPKKPAL